MQAVLLATNWEKWTAIGTLGAAAATLSLAAVTVWLVFTTRGMVSKAGDEIAIERQRIEDATTPNVFPAPDRHWGSDRGRHGADWRAFLPVTNGGPGVALNVYAELRWTGASGTNTRTVRTSLAAGEARNLAILWAASAENEWPQVEGGLYYNAVSGALWETKFRIWKDGGRHLIDVQNTRMLKRADGTVVE